VVTELRGEKIDVVPWSADPATFVANALQPAKVREAKVDPETQTALVIVPDYQLSLAIGREGQNARLAARLTGWRIDIKSETQFADEQRGAPRPSPQAGAAGPASSSAPASGEAETGPTTDAPDGGVTESAPAPTAEDPAEAGDAADGEQPSEGEGAEALPVVGEAGPAETEEDAGAPNEQTEEKAEA
jgi:N utilization substance protein A